MSRPIWILAAVTLLGCATPRPTAVGPELPCEVTKEALARVEYLTGMDPCDPRAITIRGAPCDRVGIAAEHEWLDHNYPGYEVIHQSLEATVIGSPCPPTSYDYFSIKLPSGETRGVTF